jgi:hypothetical protein
MKSSRKMSMKGNSKRTIIIFTFIILVSLVAICSISCRQSVHREFPMNLSEVVETNYGNTVDGDSMYWAIYEEWHNDCKRHLLYINKETYDSLEVVLEQFQKAESIERDSLNKTHGFKLIKDSEGLHLCSIK